MPNASLGSGLVFCSSPVVRWWGAITEGHCAECESQSFGAVRLSLDVKKQAVLAAKLDTLHEEPQRLESLYQSKLAALDALKKSLLHQAFTGEL